MLSQQRSLLTLDVGSFLGTKQAVCAAEADTSPESSVYSDDACPEMALDPLVGVGVSPHSRCQVQASGSFTELGTLLPGLF